MRTFATLLLIFAMACTAGGDASTDALISREGVGLGTEEEVAMLLDAAEIPHSYEIYAQGLSRSSGPSGGSGWNSTDIVLEGKVTRCAAVQPEYYRNCEGIHTMPQVLEWARAAQREGEWQNATRSEDGGQVCFSARTQICFSDDMLTYLGDGSDFVRFMPVG